MDIKRILLAIVTFALGAVLLFFIWQDAAADKARDSAKVKAEVEARQYEIRIQELEAEIKAQERAAEVTPDQGTAVIAYQLAAPEDVSFVVSMGETYGFKPTVVLDCGQTEENLRLIAEALAEAGNPADIMLTGSPFTDEVLANARMLLAEMPSYGFRGGISFLLRKSDDSSENRAFILDEAFAGYAFYSDNGACGTLPSGTPYLSYSFIRTMDSSIDSSLRTVRSNKVSMAIVLDLVSCAQGTLTFDRVTEWTAAIADAGARGEMNVQSADKAYGVLRTIRAQNDEAAAEYEAFRSSKQAEIAELQEKIEEIKR